MLRELGNKGLIPGLHEVELVRAKICRLTDPLGDMLTRIRNWPAGPQGQRALARVQARVRVLDVLQREGYIRGYQEETTGPQKGVRIELKYFEGQPAIQHVSRVSKPGRRVYSGSQELPRVRNGLGITIVSTPKGVLSDAEAREQNVGGEVLAEVF
jgi:small subunit ribosomal protein S8